MKAHIILFLFLPLTISCSESTSKGIDMEPTQVKSSESIIPSIDEKKAIDLRMSKDFLHGVWQNMDHSEIDFILHLNIVDELVLGEYCSKAKDFFLEDCALEDEGGYCSVRGPFNKFNVEVGLESCLNAEVGDAFIRRQGAEIVLILDKAAGEYGVDHLVPDTTILKKIANEPYF